MTEFLKGKILPVLAISFFALAVVNDSFGQRRTSPTPTPTPEYPAVIRLADDEEPQPVYTQPQPIPQTTSSDLEERIRSLESTKNSKDPDAVKKSLLLNLDILTRAEQRVELLRKQLFDLLEKESSITTRLDALEYEMSPEYLDRTLAFTGSLRPEEVRERKLKSLQAEKTNLTSLLSTIQTNRTRIEASVARAEQLVERLSQKLELDIEKSLEDTPQN